jgi:tRNA pseudouridine-54 N-methylase
MDRTPSSNRSLGQQVHDALVRAAEKKAAALRARKLAERVYDRILLDTEGKTVGEREAKARTTPKFVAMDDDALTAEEEAIIAKARADGLSVEFEEYRTREATARAEMNLR